MHQTPLFYFDPVLFMDKLYKSLTQHVKLSADELSTIKGSQNSGVGKKQKTKKQQASTVELEPSSVKALREKDKIRVFGSSDIPDPISSFSQLWSNVDQESAFLGQIMARTAFVNPTAVQKQVLPILIDRRDVMACAPTGSGKTLAFLLPILALLQRHDKAAGFRALILVPTRELALQIERECFKISGQFKVCLLAKDKVAGFKASPKHSFDILVSTPLTLIAALEDQVVSLNALKVLILDEADRLLEENFLEQTDAVLSACPSDVVKGIFTTTLNSSVELLAASFMRDPVRVYVGTQNAATETIKQELLFVGQEEGKLMAVRNIFRDGIQPPILIFLDSIDRANDLYLQLLQDGIPSDVIHSEKSLAEVCAFIPLFFALFYHDLPFRGPPS